MIKRQVSALSIVLYSASFLGLAWAQECQMEQTHAQARQTTEMTTGFPSSLDTPEKRANLIDIILLNITDPNSYHATMPQEDQDILISTAAAANSEHDFYTAIRHWFAELEKHDGVSSFRSPHELIVDGGNQPFAGVGITINFRSTDPFLTVLAVRPDGPAAQAGIKPRDRIIAVDAQSCQPVYVIRGEEGSSVSLTVQSPGEEARELSMNRVMFRSFPPPDRQAAFLLEQQSAIGYIFVRSVMAADREAVKQLLEEANIRPQDGLEGLILDLRHGGAGSVEALVQWLGSLLDNRRPYAFRDASGRDNPVLVPVQEPDFRSLPLAVLVDDTTVGLFVWLAAALQGRENTVIIGQTTDFAAFTLNRRTLTGGVDVSFPTNMFLISKGVGVNRYFEPLPEGRVIPDVVLEGDGFAFSVENDPYVITALSELAKMR